MRSERRVPQSRTVGRPLRNERKDQVAKDPPGSWRCPHCGEVWETKVPQCTICGNFAERDAWDEKNAPDEVNHPSHYGGDVLYEVIKVEEALDLVSDHYLASVFEYISRWKRKGGIQDLEKARWWLDRRIQREKNGTDENGVTIIKEGS
jgi:hypothetical protein